MKIAVVLPVEERFDPIAGGAIARWVDSVYGYVDEEKTVFAPPPLEGRTYNTPLWRSAKTDWVDKALTNLAILLSRSGIADPVAWRGRLFLRGRLWIRLIFRELRTFDVIHVHNRPTYVEWIRRSGYKGKIVLHMHNSLSPDRPDHRLEAISHADSVFFCSNFLRLEAQIAYDHKLPPSFVVFNGVNPGTEPIVPYDKRKRGLLVTAGRLVPEKGAMQAIEITRQLHALGHEVELKICGSFFFGSDFQSPYVQALQAAADDACRLAGKNIVTLVGQLPHDKLLSLFGQAIAFVYPCIWNEPFGMVVVEAMSRGTPVIASRLGGIPEVVGDDMIESSTVDAGDLDGFIRKCTALLSDERCWEEHSSEALNRSQSTFGWDAIAHDFASKLRGRVESGARATSIEN